MEIVKPNLTPVEIIDQAIEYVKDAEVVTPEVEALLKTLDEFLGKPVALNKIIEAIDKGDKVLPLIVDFLEGLKAVITK